jgi:hypothetical protein
MMKRDIYAELMKGKASSRREPLLLQFQFQPERLVRNNLLNRKRDVNLINLPLYAISMLPSVIG